ncbi:MAG: 4-hydroxy-tetrahydrodipicolinate reductase [Lachnospiraceae bacterium]|nr:4-hydroxy-tetrahydrodipicolinate reductase [Lachnospiraceae bacterium]
MVRIIMRGCNGKMGRNITDLVKADSEAEIVAGIDFFDGVKNDYPVYKSMGEVKEEADVVIDFASPDMLDDLLEYGIANNVALVLCTTGYSLDDLDKINEASKKVAILRSANMSVGINTMMKVLETVSAVLADAGFDIEIVEKHHNQKLDAPSGTALALADTINECLDDEYTYTYDRSDKREKRPKKEIGLSAVRGGTIVGEHEIIFAGTDEVLEFKHTAYSKVIFGKGAIQAAKFLKGKEAGMYNMRQVIG